MPDLGLSPDLFHRIDAWIVFIMAALVVCSPLIAKAQRGARDWLVSTSSTPSPYDDMAARALLRFLNSVAWFITVFPRVTTGWKEVKDAREELQKIPRPGSGTATLLMLLVVGPFLAASVGCGGTQMSRARTVLSYSGQAMVLVEQNFAPRYVAATAAARESSSSFDEYSEAIRKWARGAEAIRLAATSLRVTESTLDAIDEGMDGDIPGVLACAGVALADVLDALEGLVDIPDALTTAIRFVAAFAGSACSVASAEPTGGAT